MSNTTFTMSFRGEDHEIEGYYESGDPSVGLFGGGFIAEKITRIGDGYVLSDDEMDAVSDHEQELIHAAYGTWYDEKYPQIDPEEEAAMDEWHNDRPTDK